MKKNIIVIPILTLWLALSVALWFAPKKDISDTERRKLAQFPSFQAQSVLKGSFMPEFESASQDQFPGREVFRTTKALFDRFALGMPDSNGIAMKDGQAVKLEYPLNNSALAANLSKLTAISNQYLEGANRIVSCVVPDKALYLKGSYPTMDYDAFFDAVEDAQLGRFADIRNLLHFESYYRTDLHWNQKEIVNVAEEICTALDIPQAQNLQEKTLGEFYGVYKGQSALPMGKDTMTILTNEITDACRVTAFGAKEETAVYDLPKFAGRDPYDVFLSGANGLMTVQTPAGTGRHLVVFRDSFGSCLVPLLLQGYDSVELVDIRYLPASQLGKLMDFEGKDVLFLYSTTVLNTPGIFK